MKQRNNKPIYYNWNRTLSYNALFNLIITERGLGKTYGFIIKRLRQFVFKKRKSIFLTKYIKEIGNETPLNERYQYAVYMTIKEILNNKTDPKLNDRIKKLELKGRTIFINNKIAFSFYAISESEKAKKNPLLKTYDCIIHDECITFNKYLKDEIDQLLTFYDTVNRRRPTNDACKLFLLGNAISMYNPYIDGFKLNDLKAGYNYIKERNFLVHISYNRAYQQERKDSPITKLAGEDSKYNQMASKGLFVYDNDEFVVDTITEFEKHFFALMINEKEVTFSKIRNGYYLHTKKKANRLFHNRKPYKTSTPIGKERLNNLKSVYNHSLIYYENIEIKRYFEKEYMGRVF